MEGGRMPRQRLIVLIAVGVVALAGLGVGGYLLLRPDSKAPPLASGAFDVHTAAEPAEREQVARGVATLKQLPAELATGSLTALSPEARTQVDGVKRVFPPQSTVTVDEASWRRTGTVASVTATVLRPGESAPTTYLMLLVRAGDQWTISDAY